MKKLLFLLFTLCILNLNAQTFQPIIKTELTEKSDYINKIVRDGEEEETGNFFEGFNTWPPKNWTLTVVEGGKGWHNTNYQPFEGDSCAKHTYEQLDCNSWMISPGITVPENGILAFHNKNAGTDSFAGEHIVCYSTEGNDPTTNTFTTLENLNYSEKIWMSHVYDLKELAGQTIYIGFNYKGNDKDIWFIDNLEVKPREEFDIEIRKIETKGFVLAEKNALLTVEVKNIGQNQITDGSVKIEAGEYSSTTVIGDLDADALKVLEITFPAVPEETEYTATIESVSDTYAINDTCRKTIQAVVNPVYGFNFNSYLDISNNFVVIDKNNPRAIYSIAPTNLDAVEASVKIDDFMYFNSMELVEEAYQPKEFGKINLNTGEVTIISPAKISFKGLAHNPNDDSVYGIGVDTEEENAATCIYKINLETGEATKLASNTSPNATHALGFAIDGQGIGYILDAAGNFFHVSLDDFGMTFVNKLSEAPLYTYQSMAFDHETNSLFLSKVYQSYFGNVSCLSKISRSTCIETKLGFYGNLTQITGLSFSKGQAKAVALTEGFNTWPLTGWQIVRKGVTSTTSWEQSNDEFSEGTSSIYHKYGNGDGTETIDWLISPEINVTSDMMFSFDEYNSDMGYVGKHELLISKESADPDDEDFVVVKSFDVASDGWEKRTISLEEYANSKIYIAFRYTGDYAANWYIDNILIKEKNTKEIAVLGCNIPGFLSKKDAFVCTVKVQNLGKEKITDQDVDLIIDNKRFTGKVTLEPNAIQDIEITTFDFEKKKYFIATYAEMDGDENAQNNLVMYNMCAEDPISDTYGYVVYSEDATLKNGPIKFNPEDMETVVNMENIAENNIYPYAGTMINNIWFCNFQLYTIFGERTPRLDDKHRGNYPWMWGAIDITNGKALNTGETNKIFIEMSYNHKDKKVYAITTKDEEDVVTSDIYTVNPSNGEYEHIGECSLNIAAFAINKEGVAYAICTDKNLYIINLEDMTPTLVGNTGVQSVMYIQSMAFEHSTGRLFWNQQGGSKSASYFVDIANGEAFKINDKKGNAEITACAFPYGDTLHTVTFNVTKDNAVADSVNITINDIEKMTNYEGSITFLPFSKDAEIEYSYMDGDDAKTETVTVDKDLVIDITLTDVKEFAAHNINIYPNPSNGRINITNLANNTVTILGMQGKVVSSIEILSNNQVIDLSNLNSGMYILKTIVDGSVLTSKITVNK
ncbi:MAG: choice-of-anchor J domain-containing protein [Hyphomicrobiales bacterium]